MDDYSYDARLEEATDRLVATAERLGADWWPTPDHDVQLIIFEALLKTRDRLLRASPTLLGR